MKKTIALGMSLAALTACNTYESETLTATRAKSRVVEAKTYVASLTAVNTTSASGVNGRASFEVSDENFVAEVEMDAVASDTAHKQAVYAGTRCPVMTDDTNADGILDLSEVQTVMGAEVMKLDNDLSMTSEGEVTYPTGDATGNYNYSESIARTELGEVDLNLMGKIIVVSGVADTATLPEGIVAEDLPIACGVIGSEGQTDPQGDIHQQQQDQIQQTQQNQKPQEVEVNEGDVSDDVVVIEE